MFLIKCVTDVIIRYASVITTLGMLKNKLLIHAFIIQNTNPFDQCTKP